MVTMEAALIDVFARHGIHMTSIGGERYLAVGSTRTISTREGAASAIGDEPRAAVINGDPPVIIRISRIADDLTEVLRG